MDVYDGSQTLANILDGGDFVANFPADAGMLYAALRRPGAAARSREAHGVHAPVVAGCTANVELALSQRDPRRRQGAPRGRRQARAPRRDAAPDQPRRRAPAREPGRSPRRLERRGAGAALTTLTENYRVVSKVAPGSAYERALAALLRDLGPTS